MTTASNGAVTLASALLALLTASQVGVVACGRPARGPHYKDPKHYGVPPAETPPADEGATPGEASDAASPSAGPRAEPPPATGSAKPPPTGGDTPAGGGEEPPAVNPDDGSDDTSLPPADPNSFVVDWRYRANLDAASVMLLADDTAGPIAAPAIVGAALRKAVADKSDDALTLQQTLGDGARASELVQTIDFADGGAGLLVDETSESGVQTTFRDVGDERCPSVFICARKTRFVPTIGGAVTICAYDAAGVPTLLPIGVAPNFSGADYEAKAGEYGPYTVRQYAGADVDCGAPSGAPLVETAVALAVRVSRQPLVRWYINRYHRQHPLPVHVEVELDYRRVDGGDTARPYIDKTTRLQGRSRYYINEERHVLVKMSRTVRKALHLRTDGGTSVPWWVGSLVNGLVPYDGMQAEWTAELCHDALATDGAGGWCD